MPRLLAIYLASDNSVLVSFTTAAAAQEEVQQRNDGAENEREDKDDGHGDDDVDGARLLARLQEVVPGR